MLLTGCAQRTTIEPKKLPTVLQKDALCKATNDGITVMAKKLGQKEVKELFGIQRTTPDHLFPLLITIKNQDNRAVTFTREGISVPLCNQTLITKWLGKKVNLHATDILSSCAVSENQTAWKVLPGQMSTFLLLVETKSMQQPWTITLVHSTGRPKESILNMFCS